MVLSVHDSFCDEIFTMQKFGLNMKHTLTLFALFTSDLFAGAFLDPNCCSDDSSTLCKQSGLFDLSWTNLFECCGEESCSGGNTTIEIPVLGTLICRGNSVCRDARLIVKNGGTVHCYGGNDACSGTFQLTCSENCNVICDGSDGNNVCGGSLIQCHQGFICYNYCIGGNGVCNGISRSGTWILRDALPTYFPTSQLTPPQPSKAPTKIPTINPTHPHSCFPTQEPSAAPSFDPKRAQFIADEESGHGIFLFINIGIGIGATLVFILLLRCCFWGQASVKSTIGKDKFQFHEADEVKVEMNSISASSQLQLIQYSKVILDGSGNLVSSQAAGHSEETLYRTSQSIKEFYYQTWDVEEDDLYIRRKRKRAPSPSIKQALSDDPVPKWKLF